VYTGYKTLLEAPHISLLSAMVAPGTHIIDVGAFHGFFTIKFGQWVSAPGRVIAIEPEPENYGRLERVVAEAGLNDRVETVQAAVAERSGELRLELNPLYPVDHKLGEEGIRVNALTIDDLLEARGWPVVSLMKIDVQGAEERVLAGALRTISTYHPALFVEVSDQTLARYGSSSEHLMGTLVERGYRIHQLNKTSLSPAITMTDALLIQKSRGYADFLFLHSRHGAR
jgi:FkbM family methyltransferase